MKINNYPEYTNEYPFTVARVVDRKLWFYGAYKSKERALEVAEEVDGVII